MKNTNLKLAASLLCWLISGSCFAPNSFGANARLGNCQALKEAKLELKKFTQAPDDPDSVAQKFAALEAASIAVGKALRSGIEPVDPAFSCVLSVLIAAGPLDNRHLILQDNFRLWHRFQLQISQLAHLKKKQGLLSAMSVVRLERAMDAVALERRKGNGGGAE